MSSQGAKHERIVHSSAESQDAGFLDKLGVSLHWLPFYAWQRCAGLVNRVEPEHLIIGLADHFEPSFEPRTGDATAPLDEQERRLERWCREYPRAVDRYRDSDGRPFPHTYFYPAEQAHDVLIERLAYHCRAGWGEIEIHLHHGRPQPDTAENTRQVLSGFRDVLVGHGCLSRWNAEGPARYAFVHGNWALANSANGGFCGVNDEMSILAETGCYADFTLPSAPNPAQVAKINSIYECSLPLNERAPHRKGRDLRVGHTPRRFPIIVQGPLGLNFSRSGWRRAVPYLENSAIAGNYPASIARLRLWEKAQVAVRGKPQWSFIKLHCHGMDPRDESAMFGPDFQKFLLDMREYASMRGRQVHFVTAREMTNMILAACEGREGNPGDYRDHRLRLIKTGNGASPPVSGNDGWK